MQDTLKAESKNLSLVILHIKDLAKQLYDYVSIYLTFSWNLFIIDSKLKKKKVVILN